MVVKLDSNKFDPKRFVDSAVDSIREQVGYERVVAACSGGVDSDVTAVICYKAIGDGLACYFVNIGLMRNHDYDDVRRNLGKSGIDVKYRDCSERFLEALKGKSDPEEKRIVISETYAETLAEIARNEGTPYFAQGSNKADKHETLDAKIKTQHNIRTDWNKFGLEPIEPLISLYKNDIRGVARYLDLDSVERQPFPGPGLATRIEGEVTREKLEIVRNAHDIVEEIVKKHGIASFQTFPILLESKVTGIEDGKRDFRNLMMLRSIDSEDAVTATVTEIPYPILSEIESRLRKELPVYTVYDITPKKRPPEPSRTIEII